MSNTPRLVTSIPWETVPWVSPSVMAMEVYPRKTRSVFQKKKFLAQTSAPSPLLSSWAEANLQNEASPMSCLTLILRSDTQGALTNFLWPSFRFSRVLRAITRRQGHGLLRSSVTLTTTMSWILPKKLLMLISWWTRMTNGKTTARLLPRGSTSLNVTLTFSMMIQSSTRFQLKARTTFMMLC